MTTTIDNQLEIQTTGTNDWYASINSAFYIMDRGYHATFVAGMDIKTGHIVENMSAGSGYVVHCNGSSAHFYRPIGISYYGVASGQPINILLKGPLRGLGILSPAINGGAAIGYTSAAVSTNTPGAVEYWGSGRIVIGWGLADGILFTGPRLPATI